MGMNKKYYIVIVAVIIILIYLGFTIFAGEREGYRLLCENAQNLKEYTACIRLDTLINQ